MNPRNLLASPGTIFTAQTALCQCQAGGVFSGMASIGNRLAFGGYKQVFQAHVDTDHFRRDGQGLRFEFTQARDEVSPSGIPGNRHSGRCGRQGTTPADIQRLAAFRQKQLAIPPFKKVLKCTLLVAQALLKRNAGNLIQERQFRLFLESGQVGTSRRLADFLLFLMERIGSPVKHSVIDQTYAAKRLCKQLCLFKRWVEPVFVGAFSHALQHTKLSVR
ncbi:hypothetical protein IQ22_04709 [Pseudomonas duriflava]|uniref:Uncharacterized protein n=1 Tax=Pseudomonas duriflava TaxID=459528 RepID=A0A562PJQ6_9PSED|nr:hypothetical protein IQ22_04709 [Pseudomonas duriflava]